MRDGDDHARPLIDVAGLRKSYGRLEVLRGVDLKVAAGARVAVIGPSGSGKSTLVRCLNHLERIDGGAIRVGDVDISPGWLEQGGQRLKAQGIARFRAGVGMVFQNFNLFPHLTVLENAVEAPVGVLGRPAAEARSDAMALLAKVDLAEKADVYPARLSGGQQQRVAIVRALMMKPAIMLFDEPTSALDPELTGEVLKVIRDLALTDRTSIIVTHELAFARDVATEIVFMDKGEVVERGPPAQVLGDPQHERTRAFIRRIA